MKTFYAIFLCLALPGMIAGCVVKHSGIGGVAGDATTATLMANENFSHLKKLDNP